MVRAVVRAVAVRGQFSRIGFVAVGQEPALMALQRDLHAQLVGEPLAVTVTCPGRVPECKFWDANISDWAGDGCAVASYTNSSITCECTHLTDFAGATGDVGSTAGSVVEMGLALSLTDLMNALPVHIT